MYILCIYCLLSVLASFQTIMASSPEDFWEEYQAAKQNGSVQNVTEHVQSLSIRLDSDTPKQAASKTSAILWFMATGGRNGIRKTSATPQEKLAMENALIFATIMDKITNPDELLSIISIRRDAGINTENDTERKHLLAVQRVITATRIMYHGSEISERWAPYIQGLFNQEYMSLFIRFRGMQTPFSAPVWPGEARKLANIMTLNFDQRAKSILNWNIRYQFDSSERHFGFTKETVSKFRDFIVESCALDSESFTPFLQIDTRP